MVVVEVVLLVVLVVLVVSGAVVDAVGDALAIVVLVVLAELPHPTISAAASSATTDPPLCRPHITDYSEDSAWESESARRQRRALLKGLKRLGEPLDRVEQVVLVGLVLERDPDRGDLARQVLGVGQRAGVISRSRSISARSRSAWRFWASRISGAAYAACVENARFSRMNGYGSQRSDDRRRR